MSPTPMPSAPPVEPKAVAAKLLNDDELTGLDYAVAVWRRRWLVAAVTLVCAVVGLAWSWFRPARYDAVLTLAVSPSKVGEQPGSAVSVASFIPVIESHTVAETVVREFKLADPPRGLTATRFLQRALSVSAIPDTNFIRVVVQLDQPELASRVANRLAEVAFEMARRVNQDEVVKVRDDLKLLLDEAATRMQDVERRYEAYRKDAQIELLRKDVDTLLAQRGEFPKLVVEIEAEKAKLARAEEELAQRERVGAVTQSITSNPALMEIAKESGRTGTNLLGLEMRNQYVNPVFMNLDQEVATSRARLAALEKQKTEMTGARKVDAPKFAKLDELYEKESEAGRLEIERDLARKAYSDVATRYQGAKLAAAGRTPQLQAVDPATPPETQVGRFLARNTLLGLLFGCVAGCFYALTTFAFSNAVAVQKTQRPKTL